MENQWLYTFLFCCDIVESESSKGDQNMILIYVSYHVANQILANVIQFFLSQMRAYSPYTTLLKNENIIYGMGAEYSNAITVIEDQSEKSEQPN